MIKKERRVSKTIFKTLQKPLQTNRTPLFTVRVFKQDQAESKSKFSISVSKKIEKSAVLRNKMRRLAYEALRIRMDEIKPGLIIHFIFNLKPKNLKDDINKDIQNIHDQFLQNNSLHPSL